MKWLKERNGILSADTEAPNVIPGGMQIQLTHWKISNQIRDEILHCHAGFTEFGWPQEELFDPVSRNTE